MWIDRAGVKEEFKKQQRPQLSAIDSDSDAQTVKTSCAATKVRLKWERCHSKFQDGSWGFASGDHPPDPCSSFVLRPEVSRPGLPSSRHHGHCSKTLGTFQLWQLCHDQARTQTLPCNTAVTKVWMVQTLYTKKIMMKCVLSTNNVVFIGLPGFVESRWRISDAGAIMGEKIGFFRFSTTS